MIKKERRCNMKRSIILNSDFLRRTRKALEYNQDYMAKQLGVTRCTYVRYEHDKPFLDKDMVSKIANVLSVDFESLVIRDMNKKLDRISNYPDDELMERLFKHKSNAG